MICFFLSPFLTMRSFPRIEFLFSISTCSSRSRSTPSLYLTVTFDFLTFLTLEFYLLTLLLTSFDFLTLTFDSWVFLVKFIFKVYLRYSSPSPKFQQQRIYIGHYITLQQRQSENILLLQVHFFPTKNSLKARLCAGKDWRIRLLRNYIPDQILIKIVLCMYCCVVLCCVCCLLLCVVAP